MTLTSEKQKEVSANFQAFRKMLPDLMQSHAGKYALLRNTKVVEFFDTPRDGLVYAMKTYPDGLFSIQEVTNAVVDLGWFSYAPAYLKLPT